MYNTKKYLIISFAITLIAIAIISLVGITLLRTQPLVLQGQVEATEIRISGKLPGRIDSFRVKEGQQVQKGDTLVVINSPEAIAKYQQVNAIEDIARYQNQKIDAGTRKQLIETALQLWNKSKSDLLLAQTTFRRISTLYTDSVVTSQRKDETEALYEAAIANERACRAQYQLALEGAQPEDKKSARSLINVAQGSVNEVAALLQDAHLTAPESGQIAAIFPKQGELVGAGMPIMNLIILRDAHVVLNVRENLLPHFKMGGNFRGDVPAIAQKDIPFKIYYISPLGSFATWHSTKQTGSYDLRTFELHALPLTPVNDLRPGMSVLVTLGTP